MATDYIQSILKFLRVYKRNKKKAQINEHHVSQISIPNIKINTMAMYNYGVGGNEVKIDSSEAINQIPSNKTLLISQLTNEEPLKPETVSGLHSIDEVFHHFKPSVKAELQNANGEQVNESLHFNSLGDFTPASIVRQSSLLNNLNIQQEQYSKIMKQLKSNRVLQTLLANTESKEAIIGALKEAIKELENGK